MIPTSGMPPVHVMHPEKDELLQAIDLLEQQLFETRKEGNKTLIHKSEL